MFAGWLPADFTPELEIYSIDEAFLGLGGFDSRLEETHRQRSFGRDPIDDASHLEAADIDHLLVEAKR